MLKSNERKKLGLCKSFEQCLNSFICFSKQGSYCRCCQENHDQNIRKGDEQATIKEIASCSCEIDPVDINGIQNSFHVNQKPISPYS